MQSNNTIYVSIHKKTCSAKFVNLNVAKINWLQPLTLKKIVNSVNNFFSVLLWNCEI